MAQGGRRAGRRASSPHEPRPIQGGGARYPPPGRAQGGRHPRRGAGAAAVARARREQAERAAVHTIEEAEKAAAAVAAEAEARAEAFASSAQGARELHRRVLQLHASLSAPESRLDGAVSVSHDEHEDEHVIDLAAIEAGEAEVRREKQVAAVESVVLDAATDESGVVPKSRFQVLGVTPGSIEAFRDELAP